MKTHQIFSLGLGLLLLLLSAQQLNAQDKSSRKKRIAVFTFEDKSDSDFGWYGTKSVGDGITDMVTTELVKTDEYRVIEREQINQLLREQDLGTSGIVTVESAAKVGQMLGVEIAVFGSVTEFGYKQRNSGVNIRGKRLGVGKQSAVAAIDLRMVNTATGEIISAENVRETKSALSGNVAVSGVSFNSQNDFDQSLVGKVTRKAVDDVVEIVADNADRIPWSAKVITVQGSSVYINSGAVDGVEVGDTFKVFRQGKALVDPDTGLELGTIDKEVGVLEVKDNTVGSGKASICSIVSGSEFERGDLVKDK